LAVPTAYVIYQGIRKKKNDWFLIIISAGICIVLARMFLPFDTDPVFRFVLLNRVANGRLLIGLGVLNGIFLVAWLRNILSRKEQLPKVVMAISAVVAAGVIFMQYRFFKEEYYFTSSYTKPYIIFLFIALLAMTILFLHKRTAIYGAIVLLAITVSMIFYVNPVYRGVIFEKDILINDIVAINNRQNGTWAVVNNLVLEQYPVMAGVRNISGVMTYPQFDIWKTFPNEPAYERIINRYAHISFQLNNEHNDSMERVLPDYYWVKIDPCDSFAQQNITYLLSISPETNQCLEKIDQLQYNQQPIFIYKIIKI